MTKVFKAVFTLTIFSLIERVLGFFFKIYLSRELGASTLGVYQIALSFFFVLLSLTTSGLPLITGKMTAAYDVLGKKKNAHSLVSAGLIINIAISAALCAIILLMQGFLANILASGDSVYILLLMLPALLFGAAGAAFRGSLWGREKYMSVSIIELAEQIARIALCITFFLVGINKLEAAAISLSAAMFVNALLCCICYFMSGGKLRSPKGQLKPLLTSSVPVSGLRAASSLTGSIMAVIIPMLFMASGLGKEAALSFFGACVGMALPLLYIPVTVVGALAYTMIPTLSKAIATGDMKEVRRQINTAVAFAVIAGAIFIPVFYALGEPLGTYVFGSEQAGQFLKLGGILIVPIALESIVSSMMNSLGLELRGFVNYMIGSAVMFAIMFCFYGRFTIDVLFWSLFVSLTLSTVLDFIAIRKKTGASLGFIKSLLISSALAYPAVCIARWCYTLFAFTPELLNIALSGILGTLALGALLFVFGLVDFGFVLNHRKKRKPQTGKRLAKLPAK